MRKRILVVDDDEMVLMALDELLKPKATKCTPWGAAQKL